MYSILLKLNLIPILFIINIISIFLGNNTLSYILMFVYLYFSVLYIYRNKVYKNSFNISNIQIIVTLFLVMLSSTIISGKVDNIIKMALLFISTILGITLTLSKGKLYISSGFNMFNNIMTIINIYGIIEFICKENIFIRYICDPSTRNWNIWYFNTNMYRNFTVFSHPIVYGNILVILFWINMYVCKNKVYKNINYILIIINLYATKSRSSWIAFFVTLLIYYFHNLYIIYCNKKINIKKTIKIILLIFLSIFILRLELVQSLLVSVIERFTVLFEDAGSVSLNQRSGTIIQIINDIKNENVFKVVLGHGYNTIQEYMINIKVVLDNFKTSDNQYISILWEFGLLGIILNIIVIFKVIYNVIFNKMNELNKLLHYIFISISVNMFFYEAYGWYIIASIYFFVIGLMCINIEYEQDYICSRS